MIIKDQKKIEVELEIRRQVDNLMREELDLLKAVMLNTAEFCGNISFICFRLLKETRVRKGKSVRKGKRERRAVRRERKRKIRI